MDIPQYHPRAPKNWADLIDALRDHTLDEALLLLTDSAYPDEQAYLQGTRVPPVSQLLSRRKEN